MRTSATQLIDGAHPAGSLALGAPDPADEPARSAISEVAARSIAGRESSVVPDPTSDAGPHRRSGGGVIARNMLGLLASQMATWVITLVSLVIVPRRFGASDFGQVQFATAYVTFFTLLGLAGTNTFIVKTVARDPATVGRYVLNAIVMKLYLTGLLAALAISLAQLLGYSQETKLLIAVGCIGMAFAVLNDSATAGLQGLERMARPAAWAAIGHYIGTGLGLAVVLTSRSVIGYALALVLINVVPAIANVIHILPRLRHVGGVDVSLWKPIARGGLPFLAWAGLLLIYGSIDIPLLEALTNETTVGWYSLAYRWVSTPIFIASVVLTAFLPSLASEARRDPAAFAARTNHALRLVGIVAIPLAVGIALVAADGITFMYQPAFEPAARVMQILSLHIPFAALDMVLGLALVASDRQKRWVIVAAFAAFTNPLLNLAAIPIAERAFENGALGAAVITVFTELLMMAGALYLRPAGVMNRSTVSYLFRCVAACAFMAPAVLIVSQGGLAVMIIVGIAAYALASFAVRTVSVAELRQGADRVLSALRSRRPTTPLETAE